LIVTALACWLVSGGGSPANLLVGDTAQRRGDGLELRGE